MTTQINVSQGATTDREEDLVALTRLLVESDLAGNVGGGLGGLYGYGVHFANAVFALRPYYWGECDCGWGAIEEQGVAAVPPHTVDCFHTRYRAEEGRHHFAERHAAMIAWSRQNGFPGAPYGMAVHCTCGHREAAAEWFDAHRLGPNGHAPACAIELPNFRHHASGLEARWYKWIGRSMEWTNDVSQKRWRVIFAECLASIPEAERAP